MKDSVTFTFNKEEAEVYRTILDEILQYRPLKEKYSIQTIEDNFHSLLARLVVEHEVAPNNSLMKKEFNHWLDNLINRNQESFEFIEIIENISLGKVYSIGLAKLKPASELEIQSLKESVYKSLDKIANLSVTSRQQFEKYLEDVFENLANQQDIAFISTSVHAIDKRKGYEVAYRRFVEAIDLLRVLGEIGSPSRLIRRPIGLQGLGIEGDSLKIIKSQKDKYEFQRQSNSGPYQFKKNNIERFENTNFALVDDILRKEPDKRSELESRIVNSIKWVSEAVHDRGDASRFLKLCISLEGLLCAKGEHALSTTLSERVAFLLAPNQEKRLVIYKNCKNIYGIRSDIAHDGRPKNVDKMKRFEPMVLIYAIKIIDVVIGLVKDEEWNNFKDLKQHLDKLKFS